MLRNRRNPNLLGNLLRKVIHMIPVAHLNLRKKRNPNVLVNLLKVLQIDIADTSTEESDSSHETTSSEALLLSYYAKQIDSSEEEMADAERTKSIKKGKRDAKKAIEEKVGICKKQKEPKPTTIRGERIEGADIDDIAPTTSEESVFSQDVRSSSEISSLEAAMLAEYVDNDSEEEMLKSFSSKRVSKDSTKSKESSDDDESLDDDEDTPVPVKTASAKPAANVEESSESEEEESEKEEEEGSNEEDEPKTVKKKKVTDVEMVDAPSAAKKAPQTPATGSKTLFMGNLSFSIEENDVINFFKDAGEVVQVRFAMRDNCFAGYGHVEFATPDAAQKALELNGEDLVGRAVKLDFAKERGGAYTQGGFSGGRGGGGRFGGRDGGGGRGRGRGPSRPSMATLGTGKKTTFGDD
ncbi:uncharacterized protein [Rutidosis leptorrhynchoides]|uniref:uncharacterized protein isoform X2 n=1 Tax=Rutidosis leptorrhynchoides TaxID=125765 RepID=UPI003A995E19